MAKFPQFRRGIAGSGRPMREGRYGDHLTQTSRMLNGELEEGDLDKKGKYKQGNAKDHVTEVTFREANSDLFVPHSLGYIVLQWQVVKKSCKGDIWDGDRPFTKHGIYLQCDTAGCKARIRMFGQQQDEAR
jgi:hypothetical protein